MHVFNRLLVVLGATAVVVACLVVLGSGLGMLPIDRLPVGYWLRDGLLALGTPGRSERLPGHLVAGGLLLLALLLLWMELRTLRGASRRPIVVTSSPGGHVTVSRTGLERLAEQVAMELDDVMEAKAHVLGHQKLELRCQARVSPAADAPGLSEELQQRLRRSIEQHVGRTVERISIHAQVEPFSRRVSSTRGR